MNYLFLSLSVAAFLPMLYFAPHRIKNITLFKKIVSLCLAAFFIVWFLLVGSSNLNDAYLTYNNPFNNGFLCFMAGAGSWMIFGTTVLIELLPFFNFRVIKNLTKTFGIVASLIATCFINQITFSWTETTSLTLGSAMISIHVGFLVAYCINALGENNGFVVAKKDLGEFFVGLLIVLVFSMPPYMPKFFLGNIGVNLTKGLKLFHRIYVYLSFVFLIGMYFLLKNKDKEYSRMVLLFISLATLISYCINYSFSIFITPTSWPLHLCNTAMFIIPLCLIFKLEKLFYFTFFINVVGAFFAMLMPNYNEIYAAFSTPVVDFWINHIMAFAMPILIVFLGVYPRPKLKHFIYSMIAFLFYFLLVLILNAWFTNYNSGVDFFFLNSDFIVTKLGKWAENTRNITWAFSIGKLDFVFYPLYQFLFFLVYIALGLIMWFIYVYSFTAQDFYMALAEKNRKIKLDEIALTVKYNKKEVSECMNLESKGKLVIKDVCKHYGNSKTNVVDQINLEVGEGEIIGFLGLNGAGKSTIIKCIVGIQPASSGTIEINGFDIEKQPVEAKGQFGFVPDHYALYENLTGREYVNYIADLYDVKKEERNERLEKLISSLNMHENIDNPIKTYSHGMKQKIAIMSALVHNPKLWILDEPLTGLDPISIYEVKECMREHAKNKNIVFFSSHIIDVVEKLCTRIIILNNHKIVADVKLDDIQKDGQSLEDFYLKTIGKKVKK